MLARPTPTACDVDRSPRQWGSRTPQIALRCPPPKPDSYGNSKAVVVHRVEQSDYVGSDDQQYCVQPLLYSVQLKVNGESDRLRYSDSVVLSGKPCE